LAPEISSSANQTLTSIAAILQAVAWPLVGALFFLTFRTRIGMILDILGQKLATATKVKAWQLELETTSEEIKEAVKKASDAANPAQTMGSIPRSQIQAAEEISQKIRNSPLPDTRALPAVREQLYSLIREYDRARRDLPSGFVRTKKMTAIVAGMRALSLVAVPLLSELISETTSGGRLAAICILQMSPDPDYFDWLIERLNNEKQAFVLFQAAVAVLELAQDKKFHDPTAARDAISRASLHISSFTDGEPDRSTLEILQTSLSKVQ
jgi:hypothetical protein